MGGPNSTHIHGTHVPVEEPSTASIGDIPRYSITSLARASMVCGTVSIKDARSLLGVTHPGFYRFAPDGGSDVIAAEEAAKRQK